jgi:hypothetical protein
LSIAIPLASIPVGVLVERRKASGPWIDYVWTPSAVLAGVPETRAWTQVSDTPEVTTFYAGTVDISLYRTETGNYRDNLASGDPKLWILLRPTGVDPAYDLLAVTADPAEGEAFTEAGNDLVEMVAMPAPIRDAVSAFITEHHVERPMFKRKRDRADPEALGRRPRGQEEG